MLLSSVTSLSLLWKKMHMEKKISTYSYHLNEQGDQQPTPTWLHCMCPMGGIDFVGYYSIADEGRIQSVVHGYAVGGGGDYRWMQTMCPLVLK
jgi:hypothetical protein